MIVRLGKTSTKRLDTCCPPIQEIIRAAAADPECPCDFGVVCGSRGDADQNNAYASGDSGAKWGESDHNVMMGDTPYSMAVDLAPYSTEINDYLWHDKDLFRALASFIVNKAVSMGYVVEWGGNYSNIAGGDMPHFSLRFK